MWDNYAKCHKGADMNFFGLILGAFMLLVIGLLHYLVIKVEYHFSTRLWPAFLVIGLFCMIVSFFVNSNLISGILGIAGFLFFWSIHEIFKQKERVRKGWFPKNPKRQIWYSMTLCLTDCIWFPHQRWRRKHAERFIWNSGLVFAEQNLWFLNSEGGFIWEDLPSRHRIREMASVLRSGGF